MIQARITQMSGQTDDECQLIDMPVCTCTRAPHDRCVNLEAEYGYCVAKEMKCDGFKLGLRMSQIGMIIHYSLLPTRPHDSQLLDNLIADFSGVAIGDKAFIDGWRQPILARKRHVELVTA